MHKFSPTKLVETYSSILFIDCVTNFAAELPESAFSLILALSQERRAISDPAKIACSDNRNIVINGNVNKLIIRTYSPKINFCYSIINNFFDY